MDLICLLLSGWFSGFQLAGCPENLFQITVTLLDITRENMPSKQIIACHETMGLVCGFGIQVFFYIAD
jgi:hypothetical protein